VRIWKVARSAQEIGATYRCSLQDGGPPGLVSRWAGERWPALAGGAELVATGDLPPLQTLSEARTEQALFERYRALAAGPGDERNGRVLLERTCLVCHSLAGQGAAIGPTLDGVGLRGTEGLLRAILTPSAAVESGYRLLRIETTDGELFDGYLASQDDQALVLRRQEREDLRLARSSIRRASFERLSVMPEGLLEALSDEDARDLLAYLATLR
jgi:putative heme-binding domain-containing protein